MNPKHAAKAASHTPGPWTSDGRYIGTKGTGSTRVIADVGMGIKQLSDTQEANARLIAAAPEMLDALKAIVDRWGDEFAETAQAVALLARIEGGGE